MNQEALAKECSTLPGIESFRSTSVRSFASLLLCVAARIEEAGRRVTRKGVRRIFSPLQLAAWYLSHSFGLEIYFQKLPFPENLSSDEATEQQAAPSDE